MDPKLISVDARDRPKDRSFHAREFKRLVALVWPHRAVLTLGLLATVVFVFLHMASLGGAFPVFRILLEQEGLGGWADRTIAGDRVGATLGLSGGGEVVRVTAIDDASAAAAGGVCLDDTIADPADRPIHALLHDLADADPGQTVTIVATDSQNNRRTIEIAPGDLDAPYRMLRWASSFIPPDADTPSGKLHTLGCILVGLVLLVIVANVFRYIGEVLIARCVLLAVMGLRTQLYQHTLQLPMSFFAGQPTADIVTRFVQDIQEIQRGLLTLFGKFIREPLKALSILALALITDWRITLTMIVVVPIAVTIFMLVGRSVKKANRKLLQAYGAMIGALTASLQNLRVVKAYTAEDHERERLRRVDLKVLKQQYKLARLQAFVSPMIETLAIVAGSFVTVWLAGRVLNHELEVSKFAYLGGILAVLFDPLRKLTDVYVRLQRSTAGAERIFQVTDHPVESDLSTSQTEIKPLEKSIELIDVTFTYPGAETPALRDVTLSIQKGETLAIVGPNGCGKTTLVSMLPRFFSPDSGRILYDGVDIRGASLKSLRTQIGLVSQEAIVFAGTPTENIAYGQADFEQAAAEDAARRAFADEFIRNIPGGYQADLGERGSTLSGGQRQRLAIARAIFRDAPILIFDEATSQVDTESERKIQNVLREFSKDRTTLIIAHRLSTIQFAKKIVVMDAGRIIDIGHHKDLFARCLLYRTLCETQFGGGA